MEETETRKPVVWIGPTRKTLRSFPKPVRDTVGFALYHAQRGAKHESVKPLRGFAGAGVLEVVENHDGNTYRAVYTGSSMSCTFSRKNRSGALKHQSRSEILFSNGSRRLKRFIKERGQ